MFSPIYRNVTIAGLPFCLIALFAAGTRADTPGLVKDKPASGPSVQTDKGFMVPYTETLPGTDITFEMVPIPGGTFKLGSPDAEPNRQPDEGPQVQITIEPFWMASHEVTWAEYKRFMAMYKSFKKLQAQDIRKVTDANKADAVTIPTPLYDPSMTYERGSEPKEPAVTMSPYAARQYTKWLSLQVSRFYRLPSEAEWEYAARAGTPNAYSFGDDPAKLGDYAWFYKNSEKKDIGMEAYHKVGTKKPNPWGLYDMHGNVSELVLDEYREDHYQKLLESSGGKPVKWSDAIAWPTRRGPRVYRGGSWDSDPEKCRSAFRGQTDEKEWRIHDPNEPKSPWWYTEQEARGVGMRIIRPLSEPQSKDDRNKFWEEDVNAVREDVKTRLGQGRAVLAPVDPDLSKAIQEIKE